MNAASRLGRSPGARVASATALGAAAVVALLPHPKPNIEHRTSDIELPTPAAVARWMSGVGHWTLMAPSRIPPSDAAVRQHLRSSRGDETHLVRPGYQSLVTSTPTPGQAAVLVPSPARRGGAVARAASLTEPAPGPASLVVPESIANLLPRADDETGFRPLFGRDAHDGWAQCGPGGFTLTNGVATSGGGMGLWWCTNRAFTNFVLRGEWRLEQPDSDSGVFVRFPDPGNDPWNAVRQGHEMEIGDDPAGKEPAWRTGALYPFSPPSRVPTRPIGEWNRYELIAVGHTYIVRINGETVNVWTDPQRRSLSGYVGLQNYQEGKGSQHRRLRIKELPLLEAHGAALQSPCNP